MTVKKSLYRNKRRGKIAGVCAGIAEYLGWELWLVRILALTGFFLLAPPFFFVVYIAGWFILEDKSSEVSGASHSSSSVNNIHTGKGWKNESTGEEKKVEIKNKVWQAGKPPAKAFIEIRKQFNDIEHRLRNMETYVTSSEFQLKRQIDQL